MFGFNGQFARYGMCVLAVALPCMVMAAPPADKPGLAVQAQLGLMTPQDRQMVLSWSPELRDKFFTLSPIVMAVIAWFVWIPARSMRG